MLQPMVTYEAMTKDDKIQPILANATMNPAIEDRKNEPLMTM